MFLPKLQPSLESQQLGNADCNSGREVMVTKDGTRKRSKQTDLEVLEELQQKILEELRSKEINPKVGDLLKALELKMKLKLPEEEKKKIWELINQLREEELDSKPQGAKRKS